MAEKYLQLHDRDLPGQLKIAQFRHSNPLRY